MSRFRHRNRCNGISSGLRTNWWYIWLTSPTITSSSFQKRSRISNILLWSFGPGGASVLRLFSLCFADASKTILTLVVALLGRTTGKCGKNHSLSGCGSEGVTTLTYPFFKYSSSTPWYALANCASFMNFFSTSSSLLSAI